MNHGQAVCSVNLLISNPRGLGPPRVFANPSCKESGVLVSDTNNHHSSSKSGGDNGSGSDKHKLPSISFLKDAPKTLHPRKLGLLVIDPQGRWTEAPLKNFCFDVTADKVGPIVGPVACVFRVPSGYPPSIVVIDGVEWLQTIWPVIPTDPDGFDSLVFKASPEAVYHVPDRPLSARRTEQNGCWHRIRLTDLVEVGQIWMQGGTAKWHVQVHLFRNQPDRTTTASVLSRKAE